MMTAQEKERYEDIAKINKQNYAKQLEEYNLKASEYLKDKAQQQVVAAENQTSIEAINDKKRDQHEIKTEEVSIS